jgi:hypothetical protein
MTIKTSTGLSNYCLVAGSFKAGLALGFLKIYSGAPPVSADDAVTGTLLCTVSAAGAGTGLSLADTATARVVTKAAEAWSGPIVATGVAGYYRFCEAGDTGVSSTTERRIQGSVGLAAADLILSNTSLTVNASITAQPIDNFAIAWPSAA